MARTKENRAAIQRMILADNEHVFECDICGFHYPESTLVVQSALRVSTLCCYEPKGGTVEREVAAANAAKKAAELTAREAERGVGKYPGRRDGLGMESLSCITAISPDPIDLTRGGAAVTVTVTGENLSASDTFDFGHASTTATVTVDSAQQITLSVTAALGTPAGVYNLTYNTNTVWRQRITVRG